MSVNANLCLSAQVCFIHIDGEREREREKERKKERERASERERECERDKRESERLNIALMKLLNED